MIEPELTDPEKIERLWGKLDLLRGENESLKLMVGQLEAKVAAREDEITQVRASAQEMAEQLASMARELNAARQAAATAVREYVAQAKG